MPIQADGRRFLAAVHDLCDHPAFFRLERHTPHSVSGASCSNPHCAGTHELAKVRQVIIQPRVDNFLFLAVDDHDRVLNVGIRVSMHRRH